MAIINDREQNGPRSRSAPADMSADDPSNINLNALFFRASVPAKYQALVAPALAIQKEKLQQDQKEKHEHETELSAVYQREIDRNILKFSIDGEDIEISQSDLRKSMQARVEVLEERRQALERSGKNPEESKRLGKLIQQYHPMIDDLENQKADAGTSENVKDLMKEDPEWTATLKTDNTANLVMNSTTDKRTSFSAQAFDDGTIVAPSLKAAFAKGTTPDVQPQPEEQPPALNKTQQAAANMTQTLGI